MRKKIVAILMMVCILGIQTSSLAFDDIKGHWAEAYIREMAAMGYVNGRSSTVFDPNGQITSEEFFSIVARILTNNDNNNDNSLAQDSILGISIDPYLKDKLRYKWSYSDYRKLGICIYMKNKWNEGNGIRDIRWTGSHFHSISCLFDGSFSPWTTINESETRATIRTMLYAKNEHSDIENKNYDQSDAWKDSYCVAEYTKPITRQRAAGLIGFFAKDCGENEILYYSENRATDFADLDKSASSTVLNQYIREASRGGVVTGRDNKMFDPKSRLTRAEACTMLKRFYVRYVEFRWG